ncbi:MAG: YkvA family protein [Cyanobacteria bacterium P01_F01_bin.150]
MESKNFIQAFYTWYRNTLRHTKYRWLIIGGTLLYLFSPLDISPDFIPVVGWLDDGIIVTLLVTEMSQVLMEQMKLRSRRSANGESAEPEVMDMPSTIDVEVG